MPPDLTSALADAMTDDEFVEAFLRGALDDMPFHHADHVRMAFLFLNRYTAMEALGRFSEALRAFAAAKGKPEIYHETITWAFVFLIRERIARMESHATWMEFAAANPDLFEWKDGILNRYYRRETLESAHARAMFVLPDRGLEEAAS